MTAVPSRICPARPENAYEPRHVFISERRVRRRWQAYLFVNRNEHWGANRKISECPLTLMHCVGLYPCPEHLLNLQCIRTLQKTYGLPVGYSGHESSVSPSVAAVILGAVAVALDHSMYGSDQAASLEPHGLVDTTRKIPNIITGRWSRSDIKHTSVYLPEAAYEALWQVASTRGAISMIFSWNVSS